ncbi:hypothetical protein FJZ17_02295 [Candidatus Pacearchaeota archaeon]|nr:hypothetical protein [Candidatus Pacearchaeota archaeon]
MNKKIGVLKLGLILSLLLISCVSLVSAYGFGSYIDLRYGSEQVIDAVVDFAEPFFIILFGGEYYTGYLVFERFLLFVILASIVYLSLSKIPMFEENKPVLKILTAAVPLIAIRFISVEWLGAIILNYQVIGVAITSGIPFIIYLFFLHNVFDSPTLRKMGWIFFLVVYMGLWSTADIPLYAAVYFWTAIASLVFFFIDGTIHKYFVKQMLNYAQENSAVEKIAEIDSRIDVINRSSIPGPSKKRAIKELEKAKKFWEKHLYAH